MSEYTIKEAIQDYQDTLCKEIAIPSLIKRNPIAHKWKVTYQSLCLRETVAWRFVDILSQSWILHENDKAIGARILLRSAIETLAMLIFLNQLTEAVVAENVSFKEFMDKVLNLFSGCRDGSTDQKATNIVTVFQKCERKYPGIEKIYGWLSESAHPNYEGMRLSYSNTDKEKMITSFSNSTNNLYAPMHEDGVLLAMEIFEHEYNDVWSAGFEKLESWLVQNEDRLESFKAKDV